MATSGKHWSSCMVLILILVSAPDGAGLIAAETSGTAVVQGIAGYVYVSTNGQQYLPLQRNAVIRPGMQIATGAGAAVDLFLGQGAGILRLTQNSRVELRSLQFHHDGHVIAYQVTLHQGILLGLGQTAMEGVKYEVSYPQGRLLSRSALFRADARGYLVALEGALDIHHGEPEGQGSLLQTPPPAFFTPQGGLQAAPPGLVQEIQNQAAAKLSAPSSSKRGPFSWFPWPFSRD